jgi:hypothetical protein
MEFGARGKFTNNVMVVGIKPFFHFHSRDIDSFGRALKTTTHSKVFISGRGNVVVSFRDGTKNKKMIKDVIVEGSIIGRDDINTSVFLDVPVKSTNVLRWVSNQKIQYVPWHQKEGQIHQFF